MDKLLPYKPYLDKFTSDNALAPLPGENLPSSRYDSFKFAFEHFEKNKGKTIVEMGTIRSFVHGGLPGCNDNNTKLWTPDKKERWDWGAGCFSLLAAECLLHLKPRITTVDLIDAHIKRCKVITRQYGQLFNYVVGDSCVTLFKMIPKSIDLLYLDTGDMTPVEPTAMQQLKEAKIVVQRNLLTDHGIILIDDVKNNTPSKYGETSRLGKSKYALPFLFEHGYKVLFDGYQVIVGKK